MKKIEEYILEESLIAISKAFDEFIGACLDGEQTSTKMPIKRPSFNAVMKARGYLPPYCKNALSKKNANKS